MIFDVLLNFDSNIGILNVVYESLESLKGRIKFSFTILFIHRLILHTNARILFSNVKIFALPTYQGFVSRSLKLWIMVVYVVQKYRPNQQVVIQISNHSTFLVTLNSSHLKLFLFHLLVKTTVFSVFPFESQRIYVWVCRVSCSESNSIQCFFFVKIHVLNALLFTFFFFFSEI